MTKPLLFSAILAAFVATGAQAAAQPAINLVTVSVARAYEKYWKTIENEQKLRADQERIQSEIEEMRSHGEDLVKEFEEIRDQSTNTALSEEARSRARDDANRKLEEIRQKQEELQTYVENQQRAMNIRQKNHRDLMLDEINKVILDIGKSRGASLILDTSGPTGIGISSVLYADPSYDITDQVIAELNKSKPAEFKDTGPASPPSAAPAPAK